MKVNQDQLQVRFDPKEILAARWYELSADVLSKVEFRAEWILPLLREYVGEV